MPPSSALLLPRLRRADPDRFFCTLFAPPEHRENLALLYLFNHELARAREVATEPFMALIRLTWWREVVEGQPKSHELATPLTEALNRKIFAREDLLTLIEARMQEAEPEISDLTTFLTYARNTAGQLACIAAKTLGEDSLLIENFGTAYGISGILRAAPHLKNRSLLPTDGTPQAALAAHAKSLLTHEKPPRAALAAALPAVYARRDLANPEKPRNLADKLAVLRAALTGRV